MNEATVNPHNFVIVGSLGLVVALGITLLQPGTGLMVTVGFLLLLIALASTSAAIYLLIFSMLLSPEIGMGQLQGRGVGGREMSIRLDDILLIVIGLTWLAKTVIYRELDLVRIRSLNRPILYYMLACVIATLFGILGGRVRPTTGFFFVLKYFEYFFIFFMVVNHVRTKDQAVRMVIAVLVTCFFICLYALLQTPVGGRATAPFEGEGGEPNTLGGYVVLIMAITSGLLLYLDGWTTRAVLGGLLVLCALALMATLSRASFLAAGVLFFAIGATQWRRPPVMASLLLVLLIVPFLAPGNVQDRVMNTFFGRQYGNEVKVMGVALDSSTSERIRSWMEVVDGWSKKPVLGYGVTGYAWADAQYVKILGETGLVGLVAFFFLLYRLWFLARQAYVREQDPFLKGLAYGFLMGMVALLFHAIGANTFIIIRIMEPFWLCAGLVLLMPILERKEPSPASTRGEPYRTT